MKKITILALLVLFIAPSTAISFNQAAKPFDTFWQAFKNAVSKRDVETIARLSRFPIGMSYGIPSIKTKAQLARRYRELFSEQSDAAVCFSKAKPEMDTQNAKLFTVACPDAAGNEVVVYHFAQTRNGWRLTALDNLNE